MQCGERPRTEQEGFVEERDLCLDSSVQSPGCLHSSEPASANNVETCTFPPGLLFIHSDHVVLCAACYFAVFH